MSFEVFSTLATSIGFILGFTACRALYIDERRYRTDMARNDVALVRARLRIGGPS